MALDRTIWKAGAVGVNILTLSIVYCEIGFPVVWQVLPKAGDSDTTERETVIEIFINLFGVSHIACLFGDCEFIGKDRFRFLKRQQIKFQMGLLKDTLVRNGCGKLAHAWRLFASTRVNHMLIIEQARRMWAWICSSAVVT